MVVCSDKIEMVTKTVSNIHHKRPEPVSDELYIRRLTVDEALYKLDQYLNDAFMAGYYQVRIVHGKGTGTLRQVVSRELKKHPLVKAFRRGEYGEGGAGVTIVELTSR
jgi:DNA mismatch repair protein MutS2